MKKSILTVPFLRWAALLAFVSLTLFPTSCSKDNPSPENDDTYVNDWILENMEYWYLWNDEIPTATNRNQSPDTYFDALLSSEDRFSWIEEDYQELLNSLQGITREAGFEFALYRESEGATTVIAQILYTKPGSPAEVAGLKRGDIITHINGQQFTTDNYRALIGALGEAYTIQYKAIVVEEERFEDSQTLSLSPVEYHENPNYYHSIITDGDKKIGYYVYNFFTSGTEADETLYDDQMDAVFQAFKSAGITDLILDLRFNSGGSEVSANNLASLIGPEVNSSKVFFKREYNEQVTQAILEDPDAGQNFLSSKFLNKSQNIGSQLTDNRVYILTSSRTASASELIINALKPYMEVFLIGDVTYGKNVGSISIYEENDPRNTWGMQPIIVKAFNSLGESDYSEGFTPDVENADNGTLIYPIGDTREALLRDAIGQITGTSTSGRIRKPKAPKDLIGHSLDLQKRSFNLIVEFPFKKTIQ
jgi:carboxyl-terminal processing protease